MSGSDALGDLPADGLFQEENRLFFGLYTSWRHPPKRALAPRDVARFSKDSKSSWGVKGMAYVGLSNRY